MIEVEKKFQPTEEQLKALLSDAKFIEEKLLNDLYYDYPDLRLYKKEIYLRKRSDNFELKIGDNSVSGVSEEIMGDEKIANYLNIKGNLKDFVNQNLIVLIDYKTLRKKYKNDVFSIDVDELSDGKDFNLKCIEIEIEVEDLSQADEAKEKIINFAKIYGFENQKALPKRKTYFKEVKPEVYKILYPNK
ncbi:CYTH domain-containing protein [Patescibacteria group bacterium]|nr:CYTH domain-containing protein [Patescibacteria group bacterium]